MGVSLFAVGVLWLCLVLWALAIGAVFDRPIPWLLGLLLGTLPLAALFGPLLVQVMRTGDASNHLRGRVIRRRDRPVAYWAVVAFTASIPFLFVTSVVVRQR